MKKRQKITTTFNTTIVMLTMLLGSLSVSGQDRQRQDLTTEEKAEMQTNMMADKLSLTEDQKTLVYEINFKYAAEMETIMQEGRTRETMRKLRDMSGRKDEELKSVLDEGQYSQYLTLKEEMRQKMKERRKSGDGK